MDREHLERGGQPKARGPEIQEQSHLPVVGRGTLGKENMKYSILDHPKHDPRNK